MKPATCQFLKLNQYENPTHRRACTIYSSVINLYYNTGIELTQEEVDLLVDTAISKGILSTTQGGSLEDNFMEVYSYIKKKYPQVKYEIFNKYDDRFAKYLDSGFMIRLGIGVNTEFTYDSQDDGIIDNQDYARLKGSCRHATNGCKWKKESSDLNKHFIFDSYFGKKEFNLYEVDFKKMKDTIMMNNAYLFFVD